MNWRRTGLVAGASLAVIGGVAAFAWPGTEIVELTGIVTTNEVIVSPQVGGRISKLNVREGDAVTPGQVLAVLEPVELEADRAFYAHTADGLRAQVEQSAAALRFEERDAATQVRQAEANLSAAEAQRAEAAAALEDARTTLARQDALLRDGASSLQDHDRARSAYDVATARAAASERQVEARQAALASARASAEQVAQRRSAVVAAEAQRAAAEAQRDKAEVRLRYAEVTAPAAGVIDVRVARAGEVVSPGQALLTLVDPDDLWVRVDVEESYVERIHLGDRFPVKLPSGALREGTVVYRGVDAGFATQRDVSRTKRDIRTFEIRLRVPNADRALAVGMTGRVLLPVRGG
jgi:multidrug resistance efflux pump